MARLTFPIADNVNKANQRKLDRMVQDVEKQVLDYYSQSLKSIRGELAEYETRGVLTKQEMQKYGRLTSLEDNINKEIGKLSGQTSTTTRSGLNNITEETYYRTAFAIEKQVKANIDFTVINPNLVEEIVRNPFDRIGWRDRSKANHQALNRQIKEQVSMGLNRGLGYRQISKNITERMNVGAEKALRIVRTEAHRCREAATLASQEQAANLGVNLRRMWVSTLDDDTRDTHQDLDGQIVGIDEPFEIDGMEAMYPGGFGVAEEDIHCRCTTIPVIEDYEPTKRKLGKEKEYIDYKTYDEWKKGEVGNG